jgi:ribonuclease HI
MKLIINTDGGSRGNPGPAAIGVVMRDVKGKVIFEKGKCIGVATNNQAEYAAVLFAMEEAKKMDGKELDFRIDSELVVKQLKGEYKIKNAELAVIFLKIHNLKSHFKIVSFKHVYREDNKDADKMVNEALDGKS